MAKLDRAAPGEYRQPRRSLRGVARWRDASQTYGALAALGALLLFNALFTPNFLTAQTAIINLTQVAPVVIVAVGMTLVVATGGIDLSVGALMAIAGALAPIVFLGKAPLLSSPLLANAAVAIPLAIGAAGLFGFFNGVLVTTFRIQPIIATLVLFLAGRGIAQVMTGGNLQTFRQPGFQYLGLGRPLGIPFQVILMLLVVALAIWAVRVTVFGRYLLAVGGNEAAARLAGVPVSRVKRAVYTVSGVLSGLAGLIAIAINSSSDANNVGLNMELTAIAAVAVGGTPLTGGRITVLGTLIGALIIQLIRFTLLAKGVPAPVAQIINALIILLAVYLQRQSRDGR